MTEDHAPAWQQVTDLFAGSSARATDRIAQRIATHEALNLRNPSVAMVLKAISLLDGNPARGDGL